MKFGFSSNAFREYDLGEAIEVLADAGYDGVELLLDEPHLYPSEADEDEIREVKDALDEHDLAVSNCNAFMLTAIESIHHPSFVEPGTSYRRRRIEYTKDALDVAAALDVPHISVEPGGPIPNGKSQAWATKTFLDGLREVAAKAESVGVDVLVEPEPDLLIETSEQFLDLVERVDSPRVKCNFDAGHFFCVGEDPAELVETLGDHSEHYHIEDIPGDRTHDHTQLGEGAMDVDGFLTALEDSGYDGYVTVELYPYQETAAETARDAMRYLEERGWA